MNIAVLGAGAWGTAIAIHLLRFHAVRLWVRDPRQYSEMAAGRRNLKYLPDHPLPVGLLLQPRLEDAVAGADLALAAVPVSGLRQTLKALAAGGCRVPVIWLCKGLEAGTALFPRQVAEQELPADWSWGALSGPSFAQEVAAGLPTAVTLASPNREFARQTAAALNSRHLRVYSSGDVAGVETAGAVKNVVAIAAGLSDGMGFGHNARAALVTRGLAEMARLGRRLGGQAETFLGLSGVGDLMLTCTGDLSRNRRVGLLLAQGLDLAEILQRLGHVAEGVQTAPEVRRMAEALGVEMPITAAVCRVLHEGLSVSDAAEALLAREPREE